MHKCTHVVLSFRRRYLVLNTLCCLGNIYLRRGQVFKDRFVLCKFAAALPLALCNFEFMKQLTENETLHLVQFVNIIRTQYV